MTNKIVCDQCQEYVKHTISAVDDDKLVTRRLCERHFLEFRKEQMQSKIQELLRPSKERAAKFLESIKKTKLPSRKPKKPSE